MFFSYVSKFAAKLQKIFDMCKYPKLAFFIFSSLYSRFSHKKMTYNTLFCKKIWSYQKKAVPLHPLFEKGGGIAQLVRAHDS